MPVKMPRSVMLPIPDPHGIVTEHDRLAMYGDFCKVVEPRKLFSQLAGFFVVIAGAGCDSSSTVVCPSFWGRRRCSRCPRHRVFPFAKPTVHQGDPRPWEWNSWTHSDCWRNNLSTVDVC